MTRKVNTVKKRFQGIIRDAETLRVSRVHLWKVLTGRRKSLRLSSRYAALKGSAK
jgi:malate synthase